MYARVITSQGAVGATPTNTTEYARTDPFGETKELPGFKAGYILVDQKTGKRMGVMLWDSAAALHDSVQVGNSTRARALARTGATLISVEEFEVIAEA
ncbi:MAG: hypothetical protein NVS1B3_15450 [Candidatus Dormibacteraceae bacterium]